MPYTKNQGNQQVSAINLNIKNMNLNPFQQAIIEDDPQTVAELINSKWRFVDDKYGFSPLEIADLLGNIQIQKLLIARKPKSIKIQLKDDTKPELISVKKFEELFDLEFHPFLTFPSYEELEEVIHNLPYLFKYQWLFGKMDNLEGLYKEKLQAHLMAKTYIKWIDPAIEYGLFADMDLPENAYIGEYTGLIREIDKRNPELNGYCFHYPTKLFSYHYYVIDALKIGNELRFINHSETPNLQPLWINSKGLLHLVFITNQKIAKDTELTFNYGKDYWRKRGRQEKNNHP